MLPSFHQVTLNGPVPEGVVLNTAVLPGQLGQAGQCAWADVGEDNQACEVGEGIGRPAHFDTINARVCGTDITDDEQVVCFAENFDTIFSP